MFSRARITVYAFVLVVVAVMGVTALTNPAGRAGPLPPGPAPRGLQSVASLTYSTVMAERADGARWYALVIWRAELDRQARERAARSRPARTVRAPSSGPVTGSCAEMAPPGFPGYIVQRESGGNPEARNPSGAYGCAQIMPEWFERSCAGMSYSQCWALIWNDGAGASNWSTG